MSYPHSYIKLTSDESKRISDEMIRLALAGKLRACKRVQVIYLSSQGQTYKQISKSLGISYRSVLRWTISYRQGGLSALLKSDK